MAIGMTGGRAPRWGAALLAGLIVVLTQAPLAAQQTVGRSTAPSVTIDYEVLESLGPEPTVPSVLLGGGMPREPAYIQGAPAPTFRAPPALRGAPAAGIGGGPRFPVLSGPNATLPADDQVTLRPPARKRAVREPAVRARRAAPPAPAPRVAGTPPVRKTRKAANRAKPPPPERMARTSPPPPPTQPMAPPVPLEPAPMAPTSAPPPVASLPPPPPSVANLPPPLPLPALSDVAPPPAPESKPVAAPEPAPARKRATRPAPRPAARPSPPPSPPAETASLSPPAATASAGGDAQIIFQPGSAKLEKAATDAMTRIVNAMKSDESMRIQLLAYAGEAGGSASQARRLSLSRALAARSYLIGQGVRSTRIDVRALGNKSSSGPPDRVDLIAVRR